MQCAGASGLNLGAYGTRLLDESNLPFGVSCQLYFPVCLARVPMHVLAQWCRRLQCHARTKEAQRVEPCLDLQSAFLVALRRCVPLANVMCVSCLLYLALGFASVHAPGQCEYSSGRVQSGEGLRDVREWLALLGAVRTCSQKGLETRVSPEVARALLLGAAFAYDAVLS